MPRNARACPECGSDEKTGWSDNAQSQRLGLPDEEFNYDEFVKEEFGSGDRRREVRPRGISWFWWSVAAALVAAFVFFLARPFLR